MEKKITTPVTKGLIIVLVLAALDIIAGFAGFRYEQWFNWLPLAIFFIGIIWACISYANQMNNAVTFGNVFGHGFKTTAVVTCLMIVYLLLSMYVIFPDTKEIAMQKTMEQLDKNPQMSDDMKEQSMEMMRKSFMLFAVLGSLFFYLVCGCIAALLGAAFAKKNPPTPFSSTNP